MPEGRVVNEYNLSPKPDIINDCEVRRQGHNLCREEMLKRIDKLFKEGKDE